MSSTFIALQKLAPQHALSRLVGRLANSQRGWLKQAFIDNFARIYAVNMSEAGRGDLRSYASFNDFFTRALHDDARPIDAQAHSIVSPADGHVSQMGRLQGDTLLQAKGHQYSLNSLAGPLGRGFEDGSFITIYLAPSDYHRVHVPAAGTLTETLAIPGALFSVNGITEAGIPGLFCRNERLVCRLQTDFGPMLVVLVGAMIVASIETVWDSPASPYQTESRHSHELALDKGAELGRFLLGSTVICCFPKDGVSLSETLSNGAQVRMGQFMAQRH